MPDLDPASPAFVKDRRSRIPRRDPVGGVRDDAFFFGLLLVVFDRFKNRTEVIDTLNVFWPELDDIRYYFQTDGETETYEAKLEWQGEKYSIAFAVSGLVIDVEQMVAMEEISSEAKMGIDEYLQQNFRGAKINRLQRQFIADDDDDSDDEGFIDDILDGDEEDYDISYEL